MTISVFALVALLLCVLAVTTVAMADHLQRRVQSSRLVVRGVAVTAAVLVPSNVYLTIAHHDAPGPLMRVAHWFDILVTLSVLVGLGAFLYTHRIPRTPVRHARRILAIGAHPDDLELACGGTLAKFHDSGHEVHVLVMSAGERGGDSAVRRTEALTASGFLGATSVQVVGLPDLGLADRPDEMVRAIEEAIRRFNPDVVLTHSRNDQHQDHHAVHLATLRAGRHLSSILCFESPSVTSDFRPSVFVEIVDYVEVKVAAVGAHRDQSGKPYMTPERIRGMASFRGAQAKIPSAEAFEPVRLLSGTADEL